MNDILKLSELCTKITITPVYKAGSPRVASVDAHVCIKSPDGCFQYADIHAEAETTAAAIARATRIAQAYDAEARKEAGGE